MKLYNKPELNVEAFDVEDVITKSTPDEAVKDNVELDSVSAGMEFSIAANGNDEF